LSLRCHHRLTTQPATDMDKPLEGVAILILEDELLAAMELAEIVGALGANVIGPVGTLREAEEYAKQSALHGAILDVKIDHKTSLQLAADLIDSGVSVVLATGYEANMLPEKFGETPRLMKPYSTAEVRAVATRHFRRAP
jgi:DNA-binding LytR/AlgR family response regulator